MLKNILFFVLIGLTLMAPPIIGAQEQETTDGIIIEKRQRITMGPKIKVPQEQKIQEQEITDFIVLEKGQAIVGEINGRTQDIGTIHVIKDKDYNVTCWVFKSYDYRNGGISCIPDSQLTPSREKNKKGGKK